MFQLPSLTKALASLAPGNSGGRRTTAPLFLPNWRMGRPVEKEWDAERAYLHGYYACSWVFACIAHISRVVSSLRWTVWEYVGGNWQRVPDGHEFEQLIEYPNNRLTRKFMMTSAVQHLYLAGNFLWKKVLIGRRIDEVWPVNPAVVTPVADASQWISKYKVRNGYGDGQPLQPEQVIHGNFVCPPESFLGITAASRRRPRG